MASAHSGSRHDLFSYTSGRYLYNEHRRPAERYVEFNVAILRLVEYWDQLVDSSHAKTTYPVTFSPEEIEEFLQTEEYWFKATSLVEY